MRLTLVIPQLLWPEPDDRLAFEGLSCPALEWLLARGTARRAPALAYEYALAEAFSPGSRPPPFGPLRLLGESLGVPEHDAREGFWLCADPVHLRFHHERIILADAGAFDLTDEEAHGLAAALNKEFGDLGQFHVAETRRWYVRLRSETEMSAQPLSAVAGRRIEGELPGDPLASSLRTSLNEIQMFLHGHPVNAARSSAGKPAVNSLWLWGAGALPAGLDTDHDGVWSGDPLALGLARATGLPAHGLPATLEALLAGADARSRQLVVLDDLLAPVLYEDSRGWRDRLQGLEERWFAPLRAALGRQADPVVLLAPTVYGLLAWDIRGGDRWKLWRQSQPLAALARELAQ